MNFNCERCNYKEFNLNDGYYYCRRCSAQSTTHRELEFDTKYMEDSFKLAQATTVPKQKSKYEETEITTWEQYNFILLGLVNELIELGAKEELKSTVLQLWTTYLRINEIAFYSRKKTSVLPKLGASFNKHDAKILYNWHIDRKSKRKKNSPSINSSVSGSQRRRHSKKLQKELLSAEYESSGIQDSNSISMANNDLSIITSRRSSSATDNSKVSPARVQFSRKARRLLKNHMPKGHIPKHEKDGALSCHTFKRLNDSRDCAPEIVSRNVLFEILYLALNQINDSIQLADLIRYLKYGHLSFYDVSHFFPPNIKLNNPLNFSIGATAFPSHKFIRFEATKQLKELNLKLKLPNLLDLCKRYVNELCLPNDLNKMIETLLLVSPPEMKLKNCQNEYLPNYEGRAMAYILFVLKLLFGLDNSREIKISKSAEKINKKLGELPRTNKPQELFVWHEWTQYIEMRDIILKQCYYPATFTTTKSSTVDVKSTTTAYLNFIKKQKKEIGPDDEELLGSRTKQTIFNNANESFQQIKKLFNEKNDNDLFAEQKRLLSLQFPPSLTPKKDNFKYIQNENRYLEYKIEICDFMKIDHTARDLLPFLYPNKLIRFMKQHKILLKPIRLKCNENIEFTKMFSKLYPNRKDLLNEANKLYEYSLGISATDWEEEIELQQTDQMVRKIMESKMVKKLIYDHVDSIKKKNNIIKVKRTLEQQSTEMELDSTLTTTVDIDDESFIITPLRTNEQIPLFDFASSDEDEDEVEENDSNDNNNDKFEFYLSNFEHWIYTGQVQRNSNLLTITEFEHLMETMPRQFEWLMKHCASIIECHERELYRELLCIENQFAYILKQFTELTNMLKLQTKHSRYDYVRGLAGVIKKLQMQW